VTAEAWLQSLDPIGWHFGLERIKTLLAALGDPQLEFESIHVVGTNGKSSVTAMTCALLEAAGRTTGAYMSPHTSRWSERVQLRGAEISAAAFEAAASKVADAVPGVEKGVGGSRRVTQFEAATAIAFVSLRDAGVEVGVIEAGLGGRLDATNVLESGVTVLTSIGLDHTQWLGETEREIAAEKLAVLRPGTTLVLGDLSAAVAAQARGHAIKLGAEVLKAGETPLRGGTSNTGGGAIGVFRSQAPYLRRNLAVAVAAAEAFLGGPLGDGVVPRALESLDLPGRFELLDGDPPVIMDAAHNPDGARALAEALRAELGERPLVACIAVMTDKDAAGIVGALAPVVAGAVCTEIPPERLEGAGRPGTSSVGAPELAALFEHAGVVATAEPDPIVAAAEAKRRAREQGGVALIAGSHYLLG